MLDVVPDAVSHVWHIRVPDTVKIPLATVEWDFYQVPSFLVLFHMEGHMDVPNEVEQEHNSFGLIESVIIHMTGLWPVRFALESVRIKGNSNHILYC